ncbi:MAG: transcriptional repressor [Emcibacteraceae bacterium]|nr:transcriptional repressor [Emcibacteraceae bacterium]
MISKINALEKSAGERVFEHQTTVTNLQSLTSNQRIVYKELLGLGRSAGAYELLDLLHKKGIKAAATVYRALNDLVKRGLVQRIVSTRKFIAHNAKIEMNRDSILLICQHCNEVSSLVDSNIIEALDKNLKQCGYHVKQYNLELMISCDSCINKK